MGPTGTTGRVIACLITGSVTVRHIIDCDVICNVWTAVPTVVTGTIIHIIAIFARCGAGDRTGARAIKRLTGATIMLRAAASVSMCAFGCSCGARFVYRTRRVTKIITLRQVGNRIYWIFITIFRARICCWCIFHTRAIAYTITGTTIGGTTTIDKVTTNGGGVVNTGVGRGTRSFCARAIAYMITGTTIGGTTTIDKVTTNGGGVVNTGIGCGTCDCILHTCTVLFCIAIVTFTYASVFNPMPG